MLPPVHVVIVILADESVVLSGLSTVTDAAVIEPQDVLMITARFCAGFRTVIVAPAIRL